MNQPAVLFVCLGNICRSPTAHAVLKAKLVAAGLTAAVRLDSAGTGDWHVGHAPDARARRAASARGIDMDELRARQLRTADLVEFDRILAMDRSNHADLRALAARTGATGQIALFSSYCAHPPSVDVPDPYAGGDDGFERVLDMIDDGTDGVLAALRDELGA